MINSSSSSSSTLHQPEHGDSILSSSRSRLTTDHHHHLHLHDHHDHDDHDDDDDDDFSDLLVHATGLEESMSSSPEQQLSSINLHHLYHRNHSHHHHHHHHDPSGDTIDRAGPLPISASAETDLNISEHSKSASNDNALHSRISSRISSNSSSSSGSGIQQQMSLAASQLHLGLAAAVRVGDLHLSCLCEHPDDSIGEQQRQPLPFLKNEIVDQDSPSSANPMQMAEKNASSACHHPSGTEADTDTAISPRSMMQQQQQQQRLGCLSSSQPSPVASLQQHHSSSNGRMTNNNNNSAVANCAFHSSPHLMASQTVQHQHQHQHHHQHHHHVQPHQMLLQTTSTTHHHHHHHELSTSDASHIPYSQQHLNSHPSMEVAAAAADCISVQRAVAFLAGPRERIHVVGNPVEHCPRCQLEGPVPTNWRPHRHIGELKIRYICERFFDDLDSNHHFDIPLCPTCNQVLYLYDFNNMLGISNARRLHKYVLKCANRHVLPLLDLFCQTKKSGERCNANFKLQWCYGTMVKRCEMQKNRDHDLWWVRYKNEWKQRRTIIRYKKDFLSHLTDSQRSLLLGLGIEGEPPPDPKSALGATFDALVSNAGGGSRSGPKVKKRPVERSRMLLAADESYGAAAVAQVAAKRRYRLPSQSHDGYLSSLGAVGGDDGYSPSPMSSSMGNDESEGDLQGSSKRLSDRMVGAKDDCLNEGDPSLSHLMNSVVCHRRSNRLLRNELASSALNGSGILDYAASLQPSQQQQQQQAQQANPAAKSASHHATSYFQFATSDGQRVVKVLPHEIINGTPTPPLQQLMNGSSPVTVSCEGLVLQAI